MKINEIFLSIEGEGLRAGLPATFIRLFGCNLVCSYCDTMYSCTLTDDSASYQEMSIEAVMEKVTEFECPNITITGGEPLIHPEVYDLIQELVNHNYWVNVETNGSIVPAFRHPYLFYTMDFKTLSSGMSNRMSMDALNSLSPKDALKFVVGSKEDMEQAVQVLYDIEAEPQVYFSPVFGQIDPQEIVKFLLDNKLYASKVQLQLHKIIWDPNKRGV